MSILVTGGAGYIGTHVLVELLASGHSCVVVDNHINSSPLALHRVKELTGKDFPSYSFDVADKSALRNVFEQYKITSVVHMAGLKAVGESALLSKPEQIMKEFGVFNIIFSSSATVYGDTKTIPITEDIETGKCTNPYGTTKLMIEYILQDVSLADPFKVISLRYFNPIGAHASGRIGEDPKGIPNNLVPFVSQVAVGKREFLSIFGDDFPTKDGTGVRDYLHVVDLAKAHKLAVEKINELSGFNAINLGTGKGSSVLDVVNGMRKASGKEIPYKIVGRRSGDIAVAYASAEKALAVLGWKAEFDLDKALADAWNWQLHNPNGYESSN